LDWVTHRGPFQPRPFCDSVIQTLPGRFWFVTEISEGSRWDGDWPQPYRSSKAEISKCTWLKPLREL